MPKGPNGEKRPADTNACAVAVARIAIGEIEDTKSAKRGSEGGKVRAERMSAERRTEIAKRAAGARWGKKEAIMTNQTACDRVAAIYEAKRKNGLKDVKFLIQNRKEASYSEVCEDLLAFKEVQSEPFDFGDLKWKE